MTSFSTNIDTSFGGIPPPSNFSFEGGAAKERQQREAERVFNSLPLEVQVSTLKLRLENMEKAHQSLSEIHKTLQAAYDHPWDKDTQKEYKLYTGLLGDPSTNEDSTHEMSDEALQISELQEKIVSYSKDLAAQITKNDTLEKNYTHLEDKFERQVAKHVATRKELIAVGQAHEKTQELLDTALKDIQNEKFAFGEACKRIAELETIESSLKIELTHSQNNASRLEVHLQASNNAHAQLRTDSNGLLQDVQAKEHEIQNLTDLLQTAEENERAYLAEIERLKEFENINQNVRAGLHTFYENPEGRFPLDPLAFQPDNNGSSSKNRASSAQHSLADELDLAGDSEFESGGSEEDSEDSDAESGHRRDSNASERHNPPTPGSPEIHPYEFITRFEQFEEVEDLSSPIEIKLSEIFGLDRRLIMVPIGFLQSGIVTFRDHEPLPATIPPPQILTHVSADVFQETIPSAIELKLSGLISQEVVPVSPRPATPEPLVIRLGGAQETVPSAIELSLTKLISQEVVPVAPRPTTPEPLVIRLGEAQEAVPSAIELSISKSIIRQELIPIPSRPASPELDIDQEIVVPSPIKLEFSGLITQEVVPVQSRPASPKPLTIGFGEAQETVPLPIVLSISDLVEEEVVPIPTDHNLTKTAVQEIANSAPRPLIVQHQAGTQTDETFVTIPESLAESAVLPVISIQPEPATIQENSGIQTVEEAVPVPAKLRKSKTTTIYQEAPTVPVLPDTPSITHTEIVYVDRPRKILAHNPVMCWLDVERTFAKLVYHAVLVPISASITRFFTALRPSRTGTAVVTSQSTQPSIGSQNSTGATNGSAIPTAVIQSPTDKLKEDWLNIVSHELIHWLFYLVLLIAFSASYQRQLWFEANENTRSFLSGLLAYRANPDHSHYWNLSFWLGEKYALRLAQVLLLAAQNIDLYQLKGNLIPG